MKKHCVPYFHHSDSTQITSHFLPTIPTLPLPSPLQQASVGECTTSKPGLLDMVARAKWNAWKELGSMSQVCVSVFVILAKKTSPDVILIISYVNIVHQLFSILLTSPSPQPTHTLSSYPTLLSPHRQKPKRPTPN